MLKSKEIFQSHWQTIGTVRTLRHSGRWLDFKGNGRKEGKEEQNTRPRGHLAGVDVSFIDSTSHDVTASHSSVSTPECFHLFAQSDLACATSLHLTPLAKNEKSISQKQHLLLLHASCLLPPASSQFLPPFPPTFSVSCHIASCVSDITLPTLSKKNLCSFSTPHCRSGL